MYNEKIKTSIICMTQTFCKTRTSNMIGYTLLADIGYLHPTTDTSRNGATKMWQFGALPKTPIYKSNTRLRISEMLAK